MKVFRFIVSALLVLVVFSFIGCKDKPKPVPNNETGFEQSLTNKDTVAVQNLVNNVFDDVINDHVQDAAAMLYKASSEDRNAEPQKLSNEEMKKVENLFNSFPFKSYHIDYIKFDESYVNEVKVTAVLQEANGKMPEVKTVFYFKPVQYLGNWYLTLVDSHNSDLNVIDRNKRDSMQSKYQEEMRDKNLKEQSQKK